MVKKYQDAEKVLKEVSEVPRNLIAYEKLMKETPTDHKNFGARKIFQRKEYSIYKVKDGFVIHNTNKKFENGHTHIRTFSKAKSIVDLCVRKKLPNKPCRWEIQSLIRVTDNQTYKNKLMLLLQTLEGESI